LRWIKVLATSLLAEAESECKPQKRIAVAKRGNGVRSLAAFRSPFAQPLR